MAEEPATKKARTADATDDTQIDVQAYLNAPESPEGLAECKKVADAFVTSGVCVLRDARVTFEDNGKFIDMMERYYNQPDEVKARRKLESAVRKILRKLP